MAGIIRRGGRATGVCSAHHARSGSPAIVSQRRSARSRWERQRRSVFPSSANDVAGIVAASDHVLACRRAVVAHRRRDRAGAGSREFVSTSGLARIDRPHGGLVTVQAPVSRSSRCRHVLAARDICLFRPSPTFDGAFVGGTAATNAAGPATLQVRSNPPLDPGWRHSRSFCLTGRRHSQVRRGDMRAPPTRTRSPSRRISREPTSRCHSRPTRCPRVAKLSAGYFNKAGMDLVDLFVGIGRNARRH